MESKTFKDVKHAVVMDLHGKIVHAPNPNRAWQDINVIETGELCGWYCFKKKD